ncbi:MAG: bifunctional diaminohydroxyphosphoribosylaminopyrimidine deaminase/5-amino-6-(5-phosphoribosylamino)uracil reductase RibD [Chloroflexi bacterium]|nr:bifunctional diaminohydroxyphosphoribosylaminopyrimidine deaminase/5-amino-6-(5-phosphoribosylamino)uracil reductase RibD [Chloroflexota bacterium]
MERALTLARQALGTTSPNPAVGAVLVKDGRIVGEGFTQPSGGPHAEIVALQQAGAQAERAILYVTLEPCSHQGRTSPCTEAIIRAGVAEAHFPCLDPNPRVNGQGQSRLEASGIKTVSGERKEEALELIEAHAKWITSRQPFVLAKYAMTLDGKIATVTGASRWITGEASRQEVHRLRRSVDAVMVGINTVLRDDPQLTARDSAGRPMERQPMRVVVDSHGRLPASARLLRQSGRTLLAVACVISERREQLSSVGTEVAIVPAEDGMVDLKALLKLLGEQEVTEVLVEGGGTLLASLFQQGLVDKVMAFIAPRIFGGRDAPTPVEGHGVTTPEEGVVLERVRLQHIGDDVLVVGYPRRGG